MDAPALLLATLLASRQAAPAPAPAALAQDAPRPGPIVRHDEGYVGPQSCGECHARQAETWHASYHRTMTQVATSAAVLAPFAGTTPLFEGKRWRLEREGEAFFATPVAESGSALGARRQVVLTTGSHHYQVYWLAAGPGVEMEALPLVWHRAEQRFAPRKAMFLMPPATGTASEAGRWRQNCIKCHATNGTSEQEDDGATTVAELGIACEACHGPAAGHLASHPPRGASPVPREAGVPEDVVHPADLDHARSSELCGQCHGILPLPLDEAFEAWRRAGFAYRPGQELAATRALLRGRAADEPPELRALVARTPGLLDELFWPDGEVRVSGREFNGLVESPCYERGPLACLTCHDLHPARTDARDLATWAEDQLRPGMDGPAACLGCHAEYADAARAQEHTHHAPGSSGADCLNCHMPYTTYGLTKTIRSHRISSPSAAVALASGRPSACNLCHLDRSLGWTADRLREWYGHERPALDPDQDEVAASVLWALQGDAGLRALAASALGWAPARAVSGTGWMPPLFSTLLLDPYDAVRWIALRNLRLDPRWRTFELDALAPLEAQQDRVRTTVLADWLARGLEAPPERRAAVLVLPDGKLDETRFRRIFARRDNREVRLAE